MIKSKRVSFTNSNRIYSPFLGTPSPSMSASSLPSSPAVSTPPPDDFDDQPEMYDIEYSCTPYPVHTYMAFDGTEGVQDKEMQIHCCLAYDPIQQPQISHDLSLPPVFEPNSPNSAHYEPLPLKEPATNPPLQSLTITCPEFLRWDIQVKASPYVGSFVSVEDVLYAMYRALRLPVNPQEYQKLQYGDRGLKEGVDGAYFGRLARIKDRKIRDVEAKKGVKRIDYLMGRTKFMGLSLTREGVDVWELTVE